PVRQAARHRGTGLFEAIKVVFLQNHDLSGLPVAYLQFAVGFLHEGEGFHAAVRVANLDRVAAVGLEHLANDLLPGEAGAARVRRRAGRHGAVEAVAAATVALEQLQAAFRVAGRAGGVLAQTVAVLPHRLIVRAPGHRHQRDGREGRQRAAYTTD